MQYFEHKRLMKKMSQDQDGYNLFGWKRKRQLPECVPPKEQNLKQMNAIYDANPRILEDVHRAVQGSNLATFHDEEG